MRNEVLCVVGVQEGVPHVHHEPREDGRVVGGVETLERGVVPEIVVLSVAPHQSQQLAARAVSANETAQRYGCVIRLVREHNALSDLQDQCLALARGLRQVDDEVSDRGFDEGPSVHVDLKIVWCWGGWLREGDRGQGLCREEWCMVQEGAAVGKEGVENEVDDRVEGVEEVVGDLHELAHRHQQHAVLHMHFHEGCWL